MADIESILSAYDLIKYDIDSLFQVCNGHPLSGFLLRRWDVEYDRRLHELRHGREAKRPRYAPGDPLLERWGLDLAWRCTGLLPMRSEAEAAAVWRAGLLAYVGRGNLSYARWGEWKRLQSERL